MIIVIVFMPHVELLSNNVFVGVDFAFRTFMVDYMVFFTMN